MRNKARKPEAVVSSPMRDAMLRAAIVKEDETPGSPIVREVARHARTGKGLTKRYRMWSVERKRKPKRDRQ